MAATFLNRVTLGAAITNSQIEFTLSSTASVAVGDLLVIRGTRGLEVAVVQVIPSSGVVRTKRGVFGTAALAAQNGAPVYTGTPGLFSQLKDNAIQVIGASAESLPDYLVPGAVAYDGMSQKYVLVDMTQTVVPGTTVVFSRDGLYNASVLTSVSQGSVGIIVENSSSDQYAWALVRGVYDHAKLVGGSSLVTSLGEFGGASSVSTPSVGLLGRSSSQRTSSYLGDSVIVGMWPTSAASTASTSASSETGLYASVYLNEPYVIRPITS